MKAQRHLAHGVALATAAAAPAACSFADPAGPSGEELAVECSGKCDGLGSITGLIGDFENIDLGDLLAVGSEIAADGINDALAGADYTEIAIGAPQAYALAEDAQDDLTLHSLDELVSGLAYRFGERELTTQVNAARRDHLAASRNRIFAESAFTVGGDVSPGWNLDVGGLGEAHARVGFEAGTTLEARVIGAYEDEVEALRAPLAAIESARGFVFPRDLGEVRAMEQGESFALSGRGALGANLGLGVPLVVADPGGLTYSLVFTAALRTRLEGEVDVQLVALEGDEVVIDVGVDRVRSHSSRIAIGNRWGAAGLVEATTDVAGYNIDLGELAESALEKQLQERLDLIEARAERSGLSTRLSVARFRLELDEVDDEFAGPALAQALRGDIRLAQALAARGEPGVRADFDLMRSGASATSHAGLDLLGMSFYSTTTESEGSAIIQTPGGARSLLFESLHKASGWFFSSFGLTRVGLAGLIFDADAPKAARGEANLFVQIMEGDDYMERDKLLDHLDAALVALGGEDALAAIEGPGNELEAYVHESCRPDDAWDPCILDMLEDPHAQNLRREAEEALAAATADLPTDLRELLRAAGGLRLTSQAIREYPAQLVGPPTSVVLDYRLDDGALAALMERRGADLQRAVAAYLKAVEIDRRANPAGIEEERAILDGVGAELAPVFDEAAARYAHLAAMGEASIEELGPIGGRALEVRFPVSASRRPIYEEAVARSFSQARSQTAVALFDELVDRAEGLGRRGEQIVGYALLSLIPSERADVRLDVATDTSDSWAQDLGEYRQAGFEGFDLYARGPAVSPLGGGHFDIDALLDIQR